MLKFTKRRGMVLLGVIAALVVAAAAIAYWTAGGSGTGSASADTTTGLTAHQTTVLSAMYPGDSPQTISGNFDNTNPGPISATSVAVSISGVTKASGAVAGTCDKTDFDLQNATMSVTGSPIPHGNGVGGFTGATIQFNNKATNQDACKGATVTLQYDVS